MDTAPFDSKLKDVSALVEKHEGYRPHAYCDACGEPLRLKAPGAWVCGCSPANKPGDITVGIGTNLDVGLTLAAARFALRERLAQIRTTLAGNIPAWLDLAPARQAALADMAYNMGVSGLLEFKDMLAAIGDRDFKRASGCMLNSKWALQVPDRAREDAHLMLTGTF